MDEESLTVRLAHHSIAQFLLGEFKGSTVPIITQEDANSLMGSISVTYLSYEVFESQIATTTKVPVGAAPSRIIQSIDSPRAVRSLALKFLQAQRRPNHDIGKVLADHLTPPKPTMLAFLKYAKPNWLYHSHHILAKERKMFELLTRVAKRYPILDGGELLLTWAVRNDHEAIFQASLRSLPQSQVTTCVLSLLETNNTIHISRLFGEGPGLGWVNNSRGAGLLSRPLTSKEDLRATVELLLELQDVDSWLQLGHDVGAQNRTWQVLYAINQSLKKKQMRLLSLIPGKNEAPNKKLASSLNTALAAVLGYQQMTRLVLDQVDTVNVDGEEQGLLSFALDHGLTLVFELLIEVGADIERLDKYGETPLVKASQDGYNDLVEALLRARANTEALNRYGETPLLVATQQSWGTTAGALLKGGAKTEVRNRKGETPLLSASRLGRQDIVEALLDSGAQTEVENGDNETPLLIAIRNVREDMVEVLLQAGANTEVENGESETPLLIAARCDGVGMVEALLRAGAKTEASNKTGETPLLAAIRFGHFNVFEALLRAGANIESQNIDCLTPLLTAIKYGRADICERLLEAGANTEARDKRGNTPLFSSLSRADEAIVRLLLGRCNLDIRDEDGNTALIKLVRSSHAKQASAAKLLGLMQILLQHGASVEVTDSSGRTPLLLAAACGDIPASSLLLDHKANINATDNTGRSPLMHASAQGNDGLVRLYLSRSADIEQRDNIARWTPLFFAANNGRAATVRLLLEHGANRNVVDTQSNTLTDVARMSGYWRLLRLTLRKHKKSSEEDGSKEDVSE